MRLFRAKKGPLEDLKDDINFQPKDDIRCPLCLRKCVEKYHRGIQIGSALYREVVGGSILPHFNQTRCRVKSKAWFFDHSDNYVYFRVNDRSLNILPVYAIAENHRR